LRVRDFHLKAELLRVRERRLPLQTLMTSASGMALRTTFEKTGVWVMDLLRLCQALASSVSRTSTSKARGQQLRQLEVMRLFRDAATAFAAQHDRPDLEMGHLRICGLAMLGGKESKGLQELLKTPAPSTYTTPPGQTRSWREDGPSAPTRVRFHEREWGYQPTDYGVRGNWRQPANPGPTPDPRLAPQQLFHVSDADLTHQRLAPSCSQPAMPPPGAPPGNGQPTNGPRLGNPSRPANARAAGSMVAPSRPVISAKNHDELVCFSCSAGTGPPDASGRKNGHVGALCPKEGIKRLGESWLSWSANGEVEPMPPLHYQGVRTRLA
jgi:hypothetical protein